MQIIKPKSMFTVTEDFSNDSSSKKKKVTKPKKPKLTRQDKALVLVDSVGKKDDTTYLVPSQSNVNEVYEVVFLYGRKFGCQCHDFLLNDVSECKHILAVQEFMKREKKERQEQELAKIVKESEKAQRKGREELTAQYASDENDGWYTSPEPMIVEEEVEEAGF